MPEKTQIYGKVKGERGILCYSYVTGKGRKMSERLILWEKEGTINSTIVLRENYNAKKVLTYVRGWGILFVSRGETLQTIKYYIQQRRTDMKLRQKLARCCCQPG